MEAGGGIPGLLCCRRKVKGADKAAFRTRFHLECTAMLACDARYDREAETVARDVPHARLGTSAERLQQNSIVAASALVPSIASSQLAVKLTAIASSGRPAHLWTFLLGEDLRLARQATLKGLVRLSDTP